MLLPAQYTSHVPHLLVLYLHIHHSQIYWKTTVLGKLAATIMIVLCLNPRLLKPHKLHPWLPQARTYLDSLNS